MAGRQAGEMREGRSSVQREMGAGHRGLASPHHNWVASENGSLEGSLFFCKGDLWESGRGPRRALGRSLVNILKLKQINDGLVGSPTHLGRSLEKRLRSSPWVRLYI